MKVVKRLLQLLTVIGSVCMIVWYVASSIINIGSILGSVLFSIAGVCAVMWDKLTEILRKLRQKKLWRIVTNTAAVLLGLAVVYTAVILCLMGVFASKSPEKESTLVVLGCQVNGRHPSLMLTRRIEAACAYLKEHPDVRCIVSGGKGNNEQISEAQCMYEQMIQRGIAPERIYLEDQSVNTEQNIAFSCKIIERENLPRSLAIVTDGFHELRAARIARRMGYPCGAVPAETPFHLAANFTTREVLAITAELLFGG